MFAIVLSLVFFSLKASESVQYFQFDKDGNMFVFEPGSGFSGKAFRVEPGFELNESTQNCMFASQGVHKVDHLFGTCTSLLQAISSESVQKSEKDGSISDKRY